MSRNTIKKWLRQPEGTTPKYQRDEVEKKIAPYAAHLNQALEADAHRPKRDRRTAKRPCEEIRAQGFAGDYSRVTEFVRDWHSGLGEHRVGTAFVPLKFELGGVVPPVNETRLKENFLLAA